MSMQLHLALTSLRDAQRALGELAQSGAVMPPGQVAPGLFHVVAIPFGFGVSAVLSDDAGQLCAWCPSSYVTGKVPALGDAMAVTGGVISDTKALNVDLAGVKVRLPRVLRLTYQLA